MCPKILKKSLTGLKIRRDTHTWLENRREGLRGGIGTDGRRKAVKEIRREKRKNLMKQSKNRHWKEKDKKRRSRNRAKMLAKSIASGLKKRSYWTSAMAWLQQLVLVGSGIPRVRALLTLWIWSYKFIRPNPESH